MIRFQSDYLEGAHTQILQRLLETNEVQTPGYGMDDYCERARGYIRKACDAETADYLKQKAISLYIIQALKRLQLK